MRRFCGGKVPMTKQEIRSAILTKLAVTPQDICWDVGAGTGSVSVELPSRAGLSGQWSGRRRPVS